MRRTSKSHKLWPGRMIKICPGLARPQLFHWNVGSVDHLLSFSAQNGWDRSQNRTNPWQSMADACYIIWYRLKTVGALEMSQEKPLELPYFACCVCWCLLALWIIFKKKITRLISASDRLWETRHRPCATPSASPGKLCWCLPIDKNATW